MSGFRQQKFRCFLAYYVQEKPFIDISTVKFCLIHYRHLWIQKEEGKLSVNGELLTVKWIDITIDELVVALKETKSKKA